VEIGGKIKNQISKGKNGKPTLYSPVPLPAGREREDDRAIKNPP